MRGNDWKDRTRAKNLRAFSTQIKRQKTLAGK